MGARYPDQVGGHKPCVPELFCTLCPHLGPFLFCHDYGRLMPLVVTGPSRTEPKKGVGPSCRESVTAVDQFCRNAVGPPEWECEAMGSVVWVHCATSIECVLSLSIAVSTVMGTSS